MPSILPRFLLFPRPDDNFFEVPTGGPQAGRDEGNQRPHGLLGGRDGPLGVHQPDFSNAEPEGVEKAQLEEVEQVEKPQTKGDLQAQKVRQAEDDKPQVEQDPPHIVEHGQLS